MLLKLIKKISIVFLIVTIFVQGFDPLSIFYVFKKVVQNYNETNTVDKN